MSRRHRAEKREILPDAKFGDIVISRFMNVLMYDGKKSVAEGIVYGALDSLKRRGGASADAVRMYLVTNGYPPDLIVAHGAGKTMPVADNATAEGRANNRRVEIIIAPGAGVSMR